MNFPTHLPDYHHHQQKKGSEEEDKISRLFKSGKKMKETDKSTKEIAMIVENLMAELEGMAKEDQELNRQSKPAINKLRKLPLLKETLSKQKLQEELLDHGVMTLLKKWLEPLPDNSLPNVKIRSAILDILVDFPIDLDRCDRRQQLIKSGLGNVIMLLLKSNEETTTNKKLAKQLVDNWCRHLYKKRCRYDESTSDYGDEQTKYHELASKRSKSSILSGKKTVNVIISHTHQRIEKKLQKLKAMKRKLH